MNNKFLLLCVAVMCSCSLTFSQTATLVSQGKPASASSENGNNGRAALGNDGSTTTRWESAQSDPQWWQVDL